MVQDVIIPPMLPETPLTKRQLGWLILAAGVMLSIAALGVDLIGAGAFAGLGPAQRQALGAGGLLMLFGASLLPLGHRPA